MRNQEDLEDLYASIESAGIALGLSPQAASEQMDLLMLGAGEVAKAFNISYEMVQHWKSEGVLVERIQKRLQLGRIGEV